MIERAYAFASERLMTLIMKEEGFMHRLRFVKTRLCVHLLVPNLACMDVFSERLKCSSYWKRVTFSCTLWILQREICESASEVSSLNCACIISFGDDLNGN